jgi:hypothetical protein
MHFDVLKVLKSNLCTFVKGGGEFDCMYFSNLVAKGKCGISVKSPGLDQLPNIEETCESKKVRVLYGGGRGERTTGHCPKPDLLASMPIPAQIVPSVAQKMVNASLPQQAN